MSDQQYWRERSARIAHEHVAVLLGIAVSNRVGNPVTKVTADPVFPDDNNPDEERSFYVYVDTLVHGDNGVVTGVESVKYRLRLERVED